MKITFSFGKNWINYVNNVVDEKIIEEAKKSLLEYLPQGDFKGKTFIDIGCGSGLFSLSALLLGCEKVISTDFDPYSLEATKLLRDKFKDIIPKEREWEIFQGNILDEKIVAYLTDKGDFVYSWGVLHHTGSMWNAIENGMKLVKDRGYFIISIYNQASSSLFWNKVKQFYNNHPLIQPLLIGILAIPGSLLMMIKNKTWRLRRERGMHVFYDVIDWLGGYPYEYACFNEIKSFVEKRGFKLIKALTHLPCGKDINFSLLDAIIAKDTACNEYMFKKG